MGPVDLGRSRRRGGGRDICRGGLGRTMQVRMGRWGGQVDGFFFDGASSPSMGCRVSIEYAETLHGKGEEGRKRSRRAFDLGGGAGIPRRFGAIGGGDAARTKGWLASCGELKITLTERRRENDRVVISISVLICVCGL